MSDVRRAYKRSSFSTKILYKYQKQLYGKDGDEQSILIPIF
jgi:hypothetical protein